MSTILLNEGKKLWKKFFEKDCEKFFWKKKLKKVCVDRTRVRPRFFSRGGGTILIIWEMWHLGILEENSRCVVQNPMCDFYSTFFYTFFHFFFDFFLSFVKPNTVRVGIKKYYLGDLGGDTKKGMVQRQQCQHFVRKSLLKSL